MCDTDRLLFGPMALVGLVFYFKLQLCYVMSASLEGHLRPEALPWIEALSACDVLDGIEATSHVDTAVECCPCRCETLPEHGFACDHISCVHTTFPQSLYPNSFSYSIPMSRNRHRYILNCDWKVTYCRQMQVRMYLYGCRTKFRPYTR